MCWTVCAYLFHVLICVYQVLVKENDNDDDDDTVVRRPSFCDTPSLSVCLSVPCLPQLKNESVESSKLACTG